MGNRAIIKPVGKDIGVYLHWNGGRDSVEAFLKYCKLRGFRDFGGAHADGYGIARFMQIVGNFFGGGLSIGLETNVKMDEKYAEMIDNGIYEVDGWEIVGRCPADIGEQKEYDLMDMLHSIDLSQPKYERLGPGFLKSTPTPTEQLRPGDVIWVYDENTFGERPKCRRYTIKGIEKSGWQKGKLYYLEKSCFDKTYLHRYLTEKEYRRERKA